MWRRRAAAVVGAALLGALACVFLLAHPPPSPSAVLGPLGGPAYTLCDPDPAHLVWDLPVVEVDGIRNLKGWLKVPILYDQPALFGANASLGFTALRVAAATRCVSGARPIFTHCGGPGTDLSCLLMNFNFGASDLLGEQFDNLAITQRGIPPGPGNDEDPPPVPFFQLDGKTRVRPFPVIKCFRPDSSYALRVVRKAYADAGLDLKPTLLKLMRVSSEPNAGTAIYLDPDLVKLNAELWAATLSECRVRPEHDLGTNAVRGRMSFLDFGGTVDLAHDLDVLRAAVGAQKLSIWGISYGTAVGATYATIFPDHIDRLVLNGNAAITDNIYGYAELCSLPYEQVWNGLAAACDSHYLEAGGNTSDPTRWCAAAPYPTQKLYAILRGDCRRKHGSCIARSTNDLASVLALVKAAFDTGPHAIMENGIYPAATILMACVQSLYAHGNYSDPGCCFHDDPPVLSEAAPGSEPAAADESIPIPRVLVGGVDMAERLNPEAMARLWARLRAEHPLGFTRASDIIGIASSPVPARPVPPFGSALDSIRPLIVGELHDPATTYTSAQLMKQAFPQGAVLTWQGYLHGLPQVGTGPPRPTATHSEYEILAYGGYGAADCNAKVRQYLKTGELPRDGTCPIMGPANSGTLMKEHAIRQVRAEGKCLN